MSSAAPSAGAGGEEDPAKALKDLLETMQSRFQHLSDSILNRIDEMGNRIDDLEQSIAALREQQQPASAPAPKPFLPPPSGH